MSKSLFEFEVDFDDLLDYALKELSTAHFKRFIDYISDATDEELEKLEENEEL